MRTMLETALSAGYAVGYFETWDQYSLEAVLEAAEESQSPVILGIGGVMMNPQWFDGGGLAGLAVVGRTIAERARVPVAFLLNEVQTLAQVRLGLRLGFNAVMLDTSELPLEENIAVTRQVAEAAHACGADVEGTLDALPDASGVIDPAGIALTDPEQALRYVTETGVDALSVAIGNVHALTGGEAQVNLAHLARLHQAVEVPLVIHGGSGFPASAVPRAIELGVAKFNVGTILKQRFLEGIRTALAGLSARANVQEVVGSRKAGDILSVAAVCLKDEVKRRMLLYGSAGKG
jgi:fructose-bisphosphate aldolase class II